MNQTLESKFPLHGAGASNSMGLTKKNWEPEFEADVLGCGFLSER